MLNNIILVASAVTSVATICTLINQVSKWFIKQEEQDKDIKSMKEEQCMICYALSATLDGLKQLNCNGRVTEAQDKMDKYINKKAHDVE